MAYSLTRTTEALDALGNPHRHVIYLDDEAQVGFTGGLTHRHEVQWIPPTEAQIDEMTGQEIAPAQDGYFQILPAEDGHTHEEEPNYNPAPKQPAKTTESEDDELVREVYAQALCCIETEQDSFDKAKEAEDMVWGKQWNETEKAQRNAAGRATLTINCLRPKVNEICGYQQQAHTDISLKPIEGGDQRTCDMYNQVIKIVLDKTQFKRVDSKFFWGLVVPGRAHYQLYIDKSKNIRGDIKIEAYPWKQVRMGPHLEDDCSDCEVIFKERVISLERLKYLYPRLADDIDKDFNSFSEESKTSEKMQYRYDHYGKGYQGVNVASYYSGNSVLVDVVRKEYRVIERQLVYYMRSVVAVFAPNKNFKNVSNWSKDEIEQLYGLEDMGIVVFEKPLRKIRITRVAGKVKLSDEYPAELPNDEFTLVTAYAYKQDLEFCGLIEDAKDPQREINKRRSQIIDIINRMGAPGYFYEPGTFENSQEEQKFKDGTANPGWVVKVADINNKPQKELAAELPASLVQMTNQDLDNLNRVLNITPRQPGANTSAAAILEAEKSKLIGFEFIFQNHALAKQRLGIQLVHAIRKYKTPEEIYRILTYANSKNPFKVGEKDFGQWTKEEVIEILQEADVTEFDVAVSDVAYSPTVRLAISQLLQNMRQNGQAVPPALEVKYLDMPEEDKQKWVEEMEAQAAAANDSATAAQQSEITKTLIGQGLYPPKIIQEYGLEAQVPQLGLAPNGQQPQNPLDVIPQPTGLEGA